MNVPEDCIAVPVILTAITPLGVFHAYVTMAIQEMA